jgi:hypothetical protein
VGELLWTNIQTFTCIYWEDSVPHFWPPVAKFSRFQIFPFRFGWSPYKPDNFSFLPHLEVGYFCGKTYKHLHIEIKPMYNIFIWSVRNDFNLRQMEDRQRVRTWLVINEERVNHLKMVSVHIKICNDLHKTSRTQGLQTIKKCIKSRQNKKCLKMFLLSALSRRSKFEPKHFFTHAWHMTPWKMQMLIQRCCTNCRSHLSCKGKKLTVVDGISPLCVSEEFLHCIKQRTTPVTRATQTTMKPDLLILDGLVTTQIPAGNDHCHSRV